MGEPRDPIPATRIVSIIYREEGWLFKALDVISSAIGECTSIGGEIAFDYTSYYRDEMGPDLRRRFFRLRGLRDPSTIVDDKLAANEIELELSDSGKRRVNIDPGNLELNRFSLASTKNAPHRLYMSRGIYVELTLVYEKGEFRPLPWTYPDYSSETVRDMLSRERKTYLDALREWRRG